MLASRTQKGKFKELEAGRVHLMGKPEDAEME